jgi:hypothetical protein
MNELLETLLMNNSDLNEQNINLDNPTIDPLNFTSNEIIGDTKKIENLEIAQYDFPNKMNWKKANIVCSSLGNGWRLPTKYEFHLLNRNKNKIGGFVNECYWSSTEYDREYAWNQNFSNGDQNTDLYESNHNVRAVRSK